MTAVILPGPVRTWGTTSELQVPGQMDLVPLTQSFKVTPTVQKGKVSGTLETQRRERKAPAHCRWSLWAMKYTMGLMVGSGEPRGPQKLDKSGKSPGRRGSGRKPLPHPIFCFQSAGRERWKGRRRRFQGPGKGTGVRMLTTWLWGKWYMLGYMLGNMEFDLEGGTLLVDGFRCWAEEFRHEADEFPAWELHDESRV